MSGDRPFVHPYISDYSLRLCIYHPLISPSFYLPFLWSVISVYYVRPCSIRLFLPSPCLPTPPSVDSAFHPHAGLSPGDRPAGTRSVKGRCEPRTRPPLLPPWRSIRASFPRSDRGGTERRSDPAIRGDPTWIRAGPGVPEERLDNREPLSGGLHSVLNG